MDDMEKLEEARMRLVETGGRVSQDLGTGRLVGQVLVYLYLQENDSSLDNISDGLELSKASVSIAVRQLEQFGLAKSVWKRGDKRKYYRSAENISKALQQGVLSLVRQKIQLFGMELDESMDLINGIQADITPNEEVEFLKTRIARAQVLHGRLETVLENPLLKLLSGIKSQKEKHSDNE